ncbi:MAG TPA: ATP-binding protein [Fibrobacteria bacterium]|nr:ATP-binding protein [Fibrobacteria bacterium]
MKPRIHPLAAGAMVLAAGWSIAATFVFLGWHDNLVDRAAATLDLETTIAARSLELRELRLGRPCGLESPEIASLASRPGHALEIVPDSLRLLPEGDAPSSFHLAPDGDEHIVSEKTISGSRVLRMRRSLSSISFPRSAWALGLGAAVAGTLLPLALLAGFLRREKRRATYLVEVARAADLGRTLPPPPPGTSGEEASLVASLGSDLRRRRILSRWEERRLARLLDSLSEGVLLLDGRLRVLVCNAPAARALGLRQAKATVRGRPLVSLVRDLVFLDDLRKAVARSDASSFDVQRDDAVFTTRVWPVPADADGAGWLVSLRDVTAQRRAERLQNRLVSDASHEFKTPLTSIRGWTETLLDDEEDEFRRKALDRVIQGTRHLEEVVRDLLDLGRIAETNTRDRPSVRLDDVCSEAISALEAEASKKRLEIEFQGAPEATVPGFRGQLVRAVINLLANAVRYSPDAGKVRVAVEAVDGSNWAISVADRGLGIPLEAQQHLFERFYRVDHGRSRDLGGTGLGLAIVQETARSHGGHAEVRSAPGQGSRFRIVLSRSSPL